MVQVLSCEVGSLGVTGDNELITLELSVAKKHKNAELKESRGCLGDM